MKLDILRIPNEWNEESKRRKVLAKEKERKKGFWKNITSKKTGHNRGPSQQTYY
jgi:hypothetical protein